MSVTQVTTDSAARPAAGELTTDIGQTSQAPREGNPLTTDSPLTRTGTDPQSSQAAAFRDTLRVRVAAVMSLACVLWGTVLGTAVTGVDLAYGRAVVGAGGLSVMAVLVAGWAAGAVAVWSRQAGTVRRLRVLEFAILVPHAGLLVIARALQFTATDSAGVARDAVFLQLAASHNGFGWLAALVAWGLVFPHPRRRMLAIHAALVACPMVTDLGLILADPSRLPDLAPPCVMTAEMLLFGFVVSLFGSHRITALQAEVADAREQAREARQLGPYALKRLLGAGGMGEVYLAEHRLLKRPCAVKLIRPDRAGDRQTLARFEREAQATARLKHPNTVDVFDYGRTEDGTFYYVMELLDGVSLEDIVRRHGPLPHGRAVHALRQLCGALREAHGAGLVHRDVKPSNALLCRHAGMFDVVKLVDFGLVLSETLAAASGHLTLAGSVMGTPDYISPEQADGTGADARSDLYSLGATAHFLLTGRPPFSGRTVLDVLFAHRHQPVAPLGTDAAPVPADLEAIVARLLAKEPRDRYPNAAAVDADLGRCADLGSWSECDAEQWWTSHAAADQPA